MTYKYLYQTRENENKSGEIKARNRAEAYAALRKQGIRPYRLIGDDPTWWRRYGIWCAVALVALVAAAATTVEIFRHTRAEWRPMKRAQLAGDTQVIAKGVAEGWPGVFDTALDRHLAAYAQPGWRLEPPEVSDDEIATFAAVLDRPMAREKSEIDEIRQLKNIVLSMRQEMREYLAGGGSVADYLGFLSERQEQECELRDKARETLERAPESLRARAWLNLNTRLGELGLPKLPAMEGPKE